jgi:hypothetical protein
MYQQAGTDNNKDITAGSLVPALDLGCGKKHVFIIGTRTCCYIGLQEYILGTQCTDSGTISARVPIIFLELNVSQTTVETRTREKIARPSTDNNKYTIFSRN